MLFNSFSFVIFFSFNILLYYLLPHRFRWILLLISSYIFYMFWKPVLLILILFSTLINFLAAKYIYTAQNSTGRGLAKKLSRPSSAPDRKTVFVFCLLINFGLLFIFKYLVFINNSILSFFSFMGLSYPISSFDIILPMGISFYTFQATGYTMDVYRNEYKPIQNFFKFSLFISFFPQLVAGPIERTDKLFPQLFTRKKLDVSNFYEGGKMMAVGFFKKLVIADRFAPYVDTVFNNPSQHEPFTLLVATILFAFQIYCDFSGYSDIAVGCARMLGIHLMQNFNRPYLSKSIREFWKRWHISLSIWFRDYFYIPLGGSRVSFLRSQMNIFLTFLVSGLWHGANWTFVIWGALHGLYQVAENGYRKLTGKKAAPPDPQGFQLLILLKHGVFLLCTFSLVSFAWIFFRANTVSDAFYIVAKLFTLGQNLSLQALVRALSFFKESLAEVFFGLLALAYLVLSELVAEGLSKIRFRQVFFLEGLYYLSLLIMILSLGVYNNVSKFIYFQF